MNIALILFILLLSIPLFFIPTLFITILTFNVGSANKIAKEKLSKLSKEEMILIAQKDITKKIFVDFKSKEKLSDIVLFNMCRNKITKDKIK